jgi:hypothetical protein
MRVFHIALVAVLLMTGCETRRDSDAEQLVRSWLTQAASGAGDRGWSLLLDDTKQTVFDNDRDGYVAQTDAVDWSSFSWSIKYVQREEPYTYMVVIAYEGELPELVASVADFEDGPITEGPTFAVWFRGILGGDGIYQFQS